MFLEKLFAKEGMLTPYSTSLFAKVFKDIGQ
jgi:hypothetical protein